MRGVLLQLAQDLWYNQQVGVPLREEQVKSIETILRRLADNELMWELYGISSLDAMEHCVSEPEWMRRAILGSAL